MAFQGQLLADGKMVYDSSTMYATGRLVLPGHAAVVMVRAGNNPLAHQFIEFLKTPQAQAILVPKGFMKPSPASVNVR